MPVWVEFLDLPMALGPFIREIADTIGEFVCEEPIRFMAARSTRRMCQS